MLKVGIFLLNEAEVLDFTGLFEVFFPASKNNEKIFKMITIGETGELIQQRC